MNKVYVKSIIIFLCLVVAGIFLYPSFKWYSKPQEEQERLRSRRHPLLKKALNLGLDLQGGMHLVLELKTDKLEDESLETVRDAMDRAMETIRNRVDQYGVAEPLIIKQGAKWIVVQMPGVKDRAQAKKLIGKTALLEFRLVEISNDIGSIHSKASELGLGPANLRPGQMPDELKTVLPENTELLANREGRYFLVKDKAEMTGAMLENAQVQLGGNNTGFPVVSLEFSSEGADLFAEITGANIERQLAIVLDGVIQSAPVIRSRIPDGRAIIEGSFTPDDAKFLKTVLQAGSLPAPMEIVEERTVGPSLGEDSIRAGVWACGIGMALVFVFMILYYRWSGVLANIALTLNILFLMGAMSMIHATLTLPGIAGVILTIGMAVDANVLIFERIREELRLGKTPRLAIDQGYSKAWSAIVDGNLTTLIAAFFLFQFGSGPIKGFGVTLMLGLVISMFTAMVVTHTIFDLFLMHRNVQKLSV